MKIEFDRSLNERMRAKLISQFRPHARSPPTATDSAGVEALARFHVALSSWFAMQEHYQPPANEIAPARAEFIFHAAIAAIFGPLASALYHSGAFAEANLEPTPSWEDAPSAGRGTANMTLVGRRAGMELKGSSSHFFRMISVLQEAERRGETIEVGVAGSLNQRGGLIPDCPALSVEETRRICQVSCFGYLSLTS